MLRVHNDTQWSKQLIKTWLRPIEPSLVNAAAYPLVFCLVPFQHVRGAPLQTTVDAFLAPSIHSEVLNGQEVLVPPSPPGVHLQCGPCLGEGDEAVALIDT